MTKVDPKIAAAIAEIELRKKRNPPHFYDPANSKIEAFHASTASVKALFGANRCMPAYTTLFLSDGRPTTMEKVKIGDEIMGYQFTGGHYGTRRVKIVDKWDTGGNKCFRLYDGNNHIDMSENHRVLVARSRNDKSGKWIKAKDIKLGDHLIQCDSMMSARLPGKRGDRSVSRMALLGLLLGDGGLNGDGIRFTNTNPEIVQFLKDNTPDDYHVVDYGKNDYYIRIPNGNKKSNGIINWLRKWKLYKKTCVDKFLPSFVYKLPVNGIKNLLKGLYATDGCITQTNGYNRFDYYSCSIRLITDIQKLLSILGITSYVMEKKRIDLIKHNKYYCLRIDGFHNTNKFIEFVGEIPGKPYQGTRINQRVMRQNRFKVDKIEDLGNLHTYDIEVDGIDSAFIVDHRIVVHNSSKTESAMMEAVFMLVGHSPYRTVKKAPVYGRVVVVDFNQLEKVVNEKLMRMIPPELFIGGKWEKSYNQKSHILTLVNGSKLDLMTHEQPVLSFEGSSRDFTVFDEEPPKDIYTSCIMRHVDTKGVAILSLTPLQGLTYLYKDVYLTSMTSKDIDSWVMSIYENKYLTAESIAAVETLIVDEVDKQIRLYGKFVSRTGMVFSNFDPTVHIYDPTDVVFDSWDGFYPPKNWMHFVGIDPGWGHPTGVVWVAVDPSSFDMWVYAEHKEAGKDPRYHANVIKAMNRTAGISRPVYVIDSQAKATDQSSGSSVAKTYARHGIPCRYGTKKLIDGNMNLNTMLAVLKHGTVKRTKLHISRECPMLVEEIGDYQRAPSTSLQNKERFIDKNNDLISALRYAVWEATKYNYNDIEDYYEERHKVFANNSDVSNKKGLSTGY